MLARFYSLLWDHRRFLQRICEIFRGEGGYTKRRRNTINRTLFLWDSEKEAICTKVSWNQFWDFMERSMKPFFQKFSRRKVIQFVKKISLSLHRCRLKDNFCTNCISFLLEHFWDVDILEFFLDLIIKGRLLGWVYSIIKTKQILWRLFRWILFFLLYERKVISWVCCMCQNGLCAYSPQREAIILQRLQLTVGYLDHRSVRVFWCS